MSKENKSKYALLGVLSLGSMSGYDLKKTIEESVGYFWKENYAQIYPMLKVLEHEGLAVGSTEKHEGKPDRRVYTITEHGKEVLKDWLVEPFGGMQVERNELLLKLFGRSGAGIKQYCACATVSCHAYAVSAGV